jgi:hypothetical protein
MKSAGCEVLLLSVEKIFASVGAMLKTIRYSPLAIRCRFLPLSLLWR